MNYLCLPDGCCSQRCAQGKDCSGSRDASVRAIRRPVFWVSGLITGNSSLSRPGRVIEQPKAKPTPKPAHSIRPIFYYALICILALACVGVGVR